MKIQLKPGVRLRHPVTRQLVGAEPFVVGDHDIFWHRRLRDGDVQRVDAKPAQPAAAKPADQPK